MAQAKAVAVIGAGQIGQVIAGMLAGLGHRVTLADQVRPLCHAAAVAVAVEQVDAADEAQLRRLLAGKDIVVSACPYFLNKSIAAAAAATGTHYFDLRACLTGLASCALFVRKEASDVD